MTFSLSAASVVAITVSFILCVLFCAFLMRPAERVMTRRKITVVEYPAWRKRAKYVPPVGGIAVIASSAFGFLIAATVGGGIGSEYVFLLAVAVLFAAVGFADDMLTTTILAAKCPKYVSPAMNTNMFENPIVQDNIKKLEHYGFHIIDPASGYLACGDTGAGKMPEPETLFSYIMKDLACEKDMVGKKVMVTAGPTQEKIDPVRYITNHSTGKMGYAIAENCMRRGAEVTLITGPVAITPPPFVKVVPVVSAADMAEAVKETAEQQDIIIKAAAVADYRPDHPVDEKVKKKDGDATLTMERTEDILSYLGAHKKPGQFLCGFSMETEHMLENSRAKLAKKNADMIVANNLKVAGAGFGTDTNVVTLITADDCRELEIMSKADVASAIVSEILKKMC